MSAENKGLGVGAYLFCCTMGGTISPIIYNALTDHYIGDDKSKNHLFGQILCIFVLFSYLGSIPFFILAGNCYKEFKEREEAEKEAEEAGEN